MSEFWVSKKKYYCKYCEIYITDDAPSRNQHENGLRHKGSKERYVRGLYKTAERNKKDAEDEKREIARIEAAAAAAYSADVGAGHGPSTSAGAASAGPSSAPAYQPKARPAKISFSISNYTSAADLGIVDEEAAKAAAEASIRQSEGRVGTWEVVTPSVSSTKAQAVKMPSHAELHSKRAAPPEDEDDARSFQVKKRKPAPGLLGEIYDPIIVKVKRKELDEPKLEDSTPSEPAEHDPEPSTDVPDAPRPAWAPLSLLGGPAPTPNAAAQHANARGDTPFADTPTATRHDDEGTTQQPDLPASEPITSDTRQPRAEAARVPKTEDDAPPEPAPSMFRKRKAPATTATRGRRPI